MSTMKEVRAAEEKMNSVLRDLKTAKTEDSNYRSAELRTASDEYTKAIRELEWT